MQAKARWRRISFNVSGAVVELQPEPEKTKIPVTTESFMQLSMHHKARKITNFIRAMLYKNQQ